MTTKPATSTALNLFQCAGGRPTRVQEWDINSRQASPAVPTCVQCLRCQGRKRREWSIPDWVAVPLHALS